MFQERYMSTQERITGDVDEFFKYYKQYRPSPPCSSSVASSEELNSNADVISSSNTSSSSVSHHFRNTIQSLLNLPGKGLTRRMRRRIPPRPIRSRSEETGISSSSRFVLQKQPLSLDRCFLPELREDSVSGSHKRAYEETLSRDSGHSSGGSPDLRTITARRRPKLVRQPFITEELPHSFGSGGISSDSDKYWRSHLESWELEPSLKSEFQNEVEESSHKSTETSNKTTNTPSTKSTSTTKKRSSSQKKKRPSVCLTLFVSISAIVLLVFGVMFIKVKMCHNNRFQAFNQPILKQDLENNLFGQHIAQNAILSAVSELNGGRVSVLIFMGSSGTGKSHATNILCHQFPIPGNIHRFSVPLHFSSPSPTTLSSLDDLSNHIPRSCGYSMVVFDDIDGIETETSEYIASFIASLEINPLSRRRSNGTIVVISSRNGGSLIDEFALNHAKSGYERKSITPQDLKLDLEPPISNIADVLLKRGVQVSIVPFLPLTRHHVRECIARELNIQGLKTLGIDVNDLMEDMSFFASDFPIFSSVGCKRIPHKVSIYKGNTQNPF